MFQHHAVPESSLSLQVIGGGEHEAPRPLLLDASSRGDEGELGNSPL